jgi:lysophospholipase
MLRVRPLLASLTFGLVTLGCAVPSNDVGQSGDEISEAPAWTTETEVADRAAYARTVLTYFDTHAVRGSFVSQHPKRHGDKGDVHIAYAIVRAPNERGAIVVANGRTESFSHYGELVYDLNRRGYTLYLIDHRGQGHSSRLLDYAAVGDADYQKGHVDDFQDYVDDFGKFVDTVVLPDHAGKPTKLFALGHSMGGAITTLYAEQHPDTFDAVALSSPMHQIQSSELKLGFADVAAWILSTHYALGMGPRVKDEPFENNALTHSRARFAAKQAVWASDPSTLIGGPTYGWVSQSDEATETLRRDAAKIKKPVLLLEAGADSVVAPEGQHEVCDKINSAHGAHACDLVVLEGSNHEGMIEIDATRREALEHIDGFFTAHAR